MTASRLGFALVLWATTARADTPTARDEEIALALEAGPPSVTAKAGVWVHDKTGYVKARDSQNGFVCLVDHRIPAASEPQCLDAEGVKTFFPNLMFYAPNMTSADLGSDGSPTSPLFVVDEKTPHALMIVSVPPAGGHAHGAAK